MEFDERVSLSPQELSERFGGDLISSGWTVDEATTELSVTLTALRTHPGTISEGLTSLSEGSPQSVVDTNTESFRQIVRLMTRGILYGDSLDEDFDPRSEPILAAGSAMSQRAPKSKKPSRSTRAK